MITVRRAVAADAATLTRLLSNMQAHYKSPDPPGGALEMTRLLTRDGERLPFALLAEHEGQPVGLAGNYARVEWTTDGTNTGAQRFYDRLGVPHSDKINYRLAGDDLKKLAAL